MRRTAVMTLGTAAVLGLLGGPAAATGKGCRAPGIPAARAPHGRSGRPLAPGAETKDRRSGD
ncbi:hypothetical protein [Streptomyces griseocarneus]|uniref:hypothetical protein n=1 Tax=Streptomyces griseocarneus TaxID=51201 RepID=UPI00167D9EC4|nr:hypothetical protein [Streptomyces griseocarneus]MBZ6474343.1 hypothetical protein [Streptomyces griseocarneus]GHG53422.1 hypothetical protein GCM10018779_15400 [Streptomyces griseocarneus]